MSLLEFHPVREMPIAPDQLRRLLQEARDVLMEQGMADMDEYGDMLKWGLPKRDGWCRNLHVFHPGFCSFSDAWRATIHFHGGRIRGHVLIGGMEHATYEAKPDPEGDRFYDGQAYRLTRHVRHHGEATLYELPPLVPHWIEPTDLTLTYFEEEDTERMGDLVEPATDRVDDHVWTQDMADALMPALLEAIDARLAALTVTA